MEVTPRGFGHLRCKHLRAAWSKPWRPLLAAGAMRAQIAVNQALPGQTLVLNEPLLWASPCAGRLEQPRAARAKRRGQPPRLRGGRKRNRPHRRPPIDFWAAWRPCFWAAIGATFAGRPGTARTNHTAHTPCIRAVQPVDQATHTTRAIATFKSAPKPRKHPLWGDRGA